MNLIHESTSTGNSHSLARWAVIFHGSDIKAATADKHGAIFPWSTNKWFTCGIHTDYRT